MKTKLTVTIDADVVPKAKEFAARQGVSLSELIEQALRRMSGTRGLSSSRRRRSRFRPAARDEERYRRLAKKYL